MHYGTIHSSRNLSRNCDSCSSADELYCYRCYHSPTTGLCWPTITDATVTSPTHFAAKLYNRAEPTFNYKVSPRRSPTEYRIVLSYPTPSLVGDIRTTRSHAFAARSGSPRLPNERRDRLRRSHSALIPSPFLSLTPFRKGKCG